MSAREYANGWCCVDCLMLLANGETPPDLSESETDEYIARVDAQCAGADVTLGRMFGELGCEHTSEGWHGDSAIAEEHSEYCERETFAWSSCDVCGSHLGGAREAVTFWLR